MSRFQNRGKIEKITAAKYSFCTGVLMLVFTFPLNMLLMNLLFYVLSPLFLMIIPLSGHFKSLNPLFLLFHPQVQIIPCKLVPNLGSQHHCRMYLCTHICWWYYFDRFFSFFATKCHFQTELCVYYKAVGWS